MCWGLEGGGGGGGGGVRGGGRLLVCEPRFKTATTLSQVHAVSTWPQRPSKPRYFCTHAYADSARCSNPSGVLRNTAETRFV